MTEYRIRETGIPDAHAQVWVVVEDLGDRLRVRRVEDAPNETCILPRAWLEPLAPPIPEEPGDGRWRLGTYCIAIKDPEAGARWRVWEIGARHAREYDNWADLWSIHGGDRTIQRLVPEATPLAVDEANAAVTHLQETGANILAEMKQDRAAEEVAEWNAQWTVGTRVQWPFGSSRTTSEAFVLNGRAVVRVAGFGEALLSQLRVVDEHAAQEPAVVAEQQPGTGAS